MAPTREPAYVAQGAYLASGTVRDALVYGLRQRPIQPRQRDPAKEALRQRWLAESVRAGNLPFDSEADWVDWQTAGVADAAEFSRRAIEVLQAVDMVKAADSGELFVLEANPGGNTWIFSKGEVTTSLKTALGVERLTDQFEAFTTAAKVLVDRTRREAQ